MLQSPSENHGQGPSDLGSAFSQLNHWSLGNCQNAPDSQRKAMDRGPVTWAVCSVNSITGPWETGSMLQIPGENHGQGPSYLGNVFSQLNNWSLGNWQNAADS